ncbi:uncharacterized protein LOC110237535 [Exaiptasia diaphana]|uniref:Activin types I and II receptor domain-containing protein n=1 Tax=Exaiptasia diaphana TaxID=2652724 RepID=A0A913X4E7_EXADI|nr:uncharacterized protein LOC110237535 [Exaiptasia diaphana]
MLCASVFLLVMAGWSTNADKMRCFCNSERCIRGFCYTHVGCYINVLAPTDRVNQTRIRYGCLVGNTTQCRNTNTSRSLCCKKQEFCNMPMPLRDAVLRRSDNKQVNDVIKPSCGASAIRQASVIIPSILIAIILLLSILIFIEWQRNHKRYKQQLSNKSFTILIPGQSSV